MVRPTDAAAGGGQGCTARDCHGTEPATYEQRHSILEGVVGLRMNYYKGDLEIEGKIPVPDADTSAGSGKKKRNTGLSGSVPS